MSCCLDEAIQKILKGFRHCGQSSRAQLNDASYQLVFVGAPNRNEKKVTEKLLEYGLRNKQLTGNHFMKIGKILLPCYLQQILILYF